MAMNGGYARDHYLQWGRSEEVGWAVYIFLKDSHGSVGG